MEAIIDLPNQLVHLKDGQTLTVIHWFDSYGFECEPDDSCSLVAGPDAEGYWLTLEVYADEQTIVLH